MIQREKKPYIKHQDPTMRVYCGVYDLSAKRIRKYVYAQNIYRMVTKSMGTLNNHPTSQGLELLLIFFCLDELSCSEDRVSFFDFSSGYSKLIFKLLSETAG